MGTSGQPVGLPPRFISPAVDVNALVNRLVCPLHTYQEPASLSSTSIYLDPLLSPFPTCYPTDRLLNFPSTSIAQDVFLTTTTPYLVPSSSINRDILHLAVSSLLQSPLQDIIISNNGWRSRRIPYRRVLCQLVSLDERDLASSAYPALTIPGPFMLVNIDLRISLLRILLTFSILLPMSAATVVKCKFPSFTPSPTTYIPDRLTLSTAT